MRLGQYLQYIHCVHVWYIVATDEVGRVTFHLAVYRDGLPVLYMYLFMCISVGDNGILCCHQLHVCSVLFKFNLNFLLFVQ